MVNELGNTLGGMAVARDYRATRMTLFDFCMARQEVKPTLKFGFQVYRQFVCEEGLRPSLIDSVPCNRIV